LFPIFIQGLLAIIGLLLYGRMFLMKTYEAFEKITVMIVNIETRAVQTEKKYQKIMQILVAGALFLTGYLLLMAIVDLDEWLQELLFGFGEIAMIGGLLFLYSGRAEKWPVDVRQSENAADLLTVDIDEVPVRTSNPAMPLLDLTPE
jgi:hypothetical protein